jgi:hypothetical protein
MTTLARFMLVLEAYLILRFAVKYGNIEAVEHILPLIAVLFLGSNKHKCARETLYLMWLLHPSISEKELRNTIGQSLLINTAGRSNSFIPLDRHLEHTWAKLVYTSIRILILVLG